MTPEQIIRNTRLHDAVLTVFGLEGNVIHMRFESIWVDEDNGFDLLMELEDPQSIMREDRPVTSVSMEGDDASVIAFRLDDGHATMVVHWDEYATRSDHVCAYEFTFDKARLTAKRITAE